jgi:predicted amidohydrolase YtcJ
MDLCLVNGNVITMALPNKREEAVAVREGRIAAVGSSRAVSALATPDSQIIDLDGKTVLPGFIDSHAHCFLTGMSLTAAQVGTATTTVDVCELVREKAAATDPGKWVYAMGCLPFALQEKRFPNISELDAAAPENPVYVSAATFHSGATNSLGMRLIDPDPELHGLEKDPGTGEPTGSFLSDTAMFFALRRAFGGLSNADILAAYRRATSWAASRGVTTLHCLDGQFVEGDRDVEVLHRSGSELPIRTVLMFQTFDVQRAVEMGLPRIGGCLTIDGAVFEHTALYHEPYTDEPSLSGDLYIPEDKIRAFVDEAHRAGLQIGMHAIGDRAVDMLVSAYAEAQQAYPREDCRHRVEHFITPTEWAVNEARELGLALPMQPIFSGRWNPEYVYFLGEQRADRSDPFKRLCSMGVVVSGGSDSPVTEINPLLGIQSAVNNPNPKRRVSVEDGLRMFTINGAWVAFEERDKGTLEAGKVADMVVLDGDPYAQCEHIDELTVEKTICGGEVVHSRTPELAKAN